MTSFAKKLCAACRSFRRTYSVRARSTSSHPLQRQGPARVESTIARITPPKRVQLLNLPNELILNIANRLSMTCLSRLLRANRSLGTLLSPVLLNLATTSIVRTKRRTILHWAAANNRVKLMTQLLNRGVRVDQYCSAGMTALHSAVLLGNEEPVKLLLKHGANTELLSAHRWTPLFFAAVTGNHKLAALLLDAGADIESIGNATSGGTALHYAAVFGHMGVVDVLVEHGCKKNARSSRGHTAWQYAAWSGHRGMFQLMLEQGGFGRNPDIDRDGETAIWLALQAIKRVYEEAWRGETNGSRSDWEKYSRQHL